MKQSLWILALACGSLLSVSGCSDYDASKGYGNFEGWGGYTKGFGDIDEGGASKQVGLCSYLGGCMPGGGDDDEGSSSAKRHSSVDGSVME